MMEAGRRDSAGASGGGGCLGLTTEVALGGIFGQRCQGGLEHGHLAITRHQKELE